MSGVPKFDDDLKERFLKQFEGNGRLAESCAAVGISPDTVRAHRKAHAEFDIRYEEALLTYRDSLEAEAHRRAVTGIPHNVYFKDQKLETEKRYSDTLLLAMLKAHRPEYRDKGSLDLNVKGGVLVVPGRIEDVAAWEAANAGNVGESIPEKPGRTTERG